MRRARRSRRDSYPDAVVATLAAEFTTLTDPADANRVSDAIARHIQNPQPTFEYILDDVVSATWRLRACHDVPGRVRLACFRVPTTPGDRDREQRINQLLDQVPPPRR